MTSLVSVSMTFTTVLPESLSSENCRLCAMGATAFQKGLGAVHALSHPIGAIYGTHHGMTNAVFLPYVLDFNREAIFAKIERLAGWLEIEGGFAGFIDFVLRLRRERTMPKCR